MTVAGYAQGRIGLCIYLRIYTSSKHQHEYAYH